MAISEAEETEKRTRNDASRPLRICFVCTGNTCRSPMAAAVANALAWQEQQKLPPLAAEVFAPRVQAFSAGLQAVSGEPISPLALQALEEAGIPSVAGADYHCHRAHSLTAEEAEGFDALVGMTPRHAMMLILQFPQCAKRITAMPEEIFDPYGGNLEIYRQCLQKIIHGVQNLPDWGNFA